MEKTEECLKEIDSDIKAKSRSRKIEGMDSDDIYQELYKELWLKFGKLEKFDSNKSSFRTWANMLMDKKLIDLWRPTKKEFTENKNGLPVSKVIQASQMRGEYDSYTSDQIDPFENLGDGGELARESMDHIDFEIALKRAKIGTIDQEILNLYNENYSLKEIADMRKMSKSEVGRRIKIAKDKMAKYLE